MRDIPKQEKGEIQINGNNWKGLRSNKWRSHKGHVSEERGHFTLVLYDLEAKLANLWLDLGLICLVGIGGKNENLFFILTYFWYCAIF